MNDVRFVANSFQQRNRRATVECKALEIIRVAVDVLAGKVMRRFDEVGWRAEGIADSHRHLRLAPAPAYFQIFDVGASQQITINLIVKRQNQKRIN